MKTIQFRLVALAMLLPLSSLSPAFAAPPQAKDWLVDPSPYKAVVRELAARHELVLENGLVSRTIRLAPNAATVDYRSLVSGEQLLRATGPEARVTLAGGD